MIIECYDLQLQVQVTTLLAANRTGGQIRTDFSTFPTPQFARVSSKHGSSRYIENYFVSVSKGWIIIIL